MSRDKQQEKRRQKALAKRKKKRAEVAKQHAPAQGGLALRGVEGWPLVGCWINEQWRSQQSLAQVLVARRRPGGGIAAAVFLVDLGCLGIKNVLLRPNLSALELDDLQARLFPPQQPAVPCALELAAKVVAEAGRYAADLGFSPHEDFQVARLFLAGVDPNACEEDVPLGREGKPFYVAGPHDDAQAIVAKLNRRLGPGNFHWLVPVDP